MLEVTPKLLRDAKAGNYESETLVGLFSSIIKPGTKLIKHLPATIDDVVLLDISFYQKTANFRQMLDNNVSGVIIRAGQNSWPDTCANTFMTDAKTVGMPIGSYWYYDSRRDPKEQAKLWMEVLADHDIKLICWADYEETYNGQFGGWRYFYDFLEWCKSYMPERKFGVYTGFYYWIEHSPNPVTQAANLAYFGQYPLWLAWYTNNPADVLIPKPWDKMTFWQRTASGDGTKYGVGSLEVDMNKFIGTKEEFKQTFNIDETGEEPMPDVTYTANIKPTVTLGAIVRATPNGTDTGQRLTANTRLQITGQPIAAGVHNWYNVISPAVGWVAEILLENIVAVPSTTPALPDVLYISTKEDGSDKKKYVVEA